MVEITKAIEKLLSVPVDLAAIIKAKDTPELKNATARVWSGSSESLESNGCTVRHSDQRNASHHLELSVLAVCQFRPWSQGASHPEDAQHRGPTLQTPRLLATWS